MGAALAQARLEAGLSHAQVADRTRIRRALIEGIEADDYSACGGDFYARANIKSIAQAIGIDPRPLLDEFDRSRSPDPDLAEPTALGVLDVAAVSAAGARAERTGPNWTVAMVVALALVLAFGGLRAVTGGDDGGSSGTVAGADVSATAGSSPSTSSEESGGADDEPADGPSQAPSDAIAAVPDGAAGEVTVELEAVEGRSWVSATGKDSGQLYQGVLDLGATQSLRDDQQVKLVIGNAGAVRLVVNGRDLGSPGGEGEVVRLTFGPGDPTATDG